MKESQKDGGEGDRGQVLIAPSRVRLLGSSTSSALCPCISFPFRRTGIGNDRARFSRGLFLGCLLCTEHLLVTLRALSHTIRLQPPRDPGNWVLSSVQMKTLGMGRGSGRKGAERGQGERLEEAASLPFPSGQPWASGQGACPGGGVAGPEALLAAQRCPGNKAGDLVALGQFRRLSTCPSPFHLSVDCLPIHPSRPSPTCSSLSWSSQTPSSLACSLPFPSNDFPRAPAREDPHP